MSPQLPDRRPRALFIDVGMTLTAPDGASMAAVAGRSGVAVEAARLDEAEAVMRRELARFSWPSRPDNPATPGSPGRGTPPRGGIDFYHRMLVVAAASGGDAATLSAAEAIWAEHLVRNVWCRVLPGVREALARLRAAGFRMATVSNSEGTIQAMLTGQGLRGFFDAVLDSWVEGIAKPDPRLFARACERLAVAPEDALMVGDSPEADVAGARAAGIAAVLIDPLDLHAAVDVPRFPSFAAFADALLSK